MFPLRDENPHHTVPVVTVALIVINVLVFGYEVSLGPAAQQLVMRWGVIPLQWGDPFSSSAIPISEWGDPTVRLLTSMFLHGGIGHLLGNLWFLWIFGDNIEAHFGKFRFILFYFVTGAVAGLVHVALNLGSPTPTIGASGAVSGILGAYLLLYPQVRIRTLIFLGIFLRVFRVPAVFFLGLWFAMQAFGQWGGEDAGVAFGAHLGGFLSGILLTVLFGPAHVNPVEARQRSI